MKKISILLLCACTIACTILLTSCYAYITKNEIVTNDLESNPFVYDTYRLSNSTVTSQINHIRYRGLVVDDLTLIINSYEDLSFTLIVEAYGEEHILKATKVKGIKFGSVEDIPDKPNQYKSIYVKRLDITFAEVNTTYTCTGSLHLGKSGAFEPIEVAGLKTEFTEVYVQLSGIEREKRDYFADPIEDNYYYSEIVDASNYYNYFDYYTLNITKAENTEYLIYSSCANCNYNIELFAHYPTKDQLINYELELKYDTNGAISKNINYVHYYSDILHVSCVDREEFNFNFVYEIDGERYSGTLIITWDLVNPTTATVTLKQTDKDSVVVTLNLI